MSQSVAMSETESLLTYPRAMGGTPFPYQAALARASSCLFCGSVANHPEPDPLDAYLARCSVHRPPVVTSTDPAFFSTLKEGAQAALQVEA